MDNFKKAISNIIEFLNEIDDGAYFVQIGFLYELQDLIDHEKYDLFYERINSVEMWGGSGALWESEYGMTVIQRKQFDILLLNLLSELAFNGKASKRAKAIYKALRKQSD